MDRYQSIESFVEFYKPYLGNFSFEGTVFATILEKQKINPNKDFIRNAMVELRNAITNIIVNSVAHNNPQDDESIMQFIYMYVEYSKLYSTHVEDKDIDIVQLFPTSDKNVNKVNEYDYCKIGALFAQGFIKRIGNTFYFKDEEFKNANQLIERISAETEIMVNSIKPYVIYTLGVSKSENSDKKNFYKNKTKHQNILEYCSTHNIHITEEFRGSLAD